MFFILILYSFFISFIFIIVEGRKYHERATPFYLQLKILKLVDLISLDTALLVFKIKNKTLPAQFYNCINKIGYIFKKSIGVN